MANVTINGTAYVLGVTKEKAIKDLYNVFYNRITSNVTDSHSPVRSKWWYPSWPDVDVNNKDSYPIGVINSPDIVWDKFTLTKKWIKATLIIEVNSTSMAELDDMASQIMNAVEITTPTFRGIRIKFVNLDGTDTDHVVRDKITVHTKIMNFSCQFSFDRSV